MERDDLSNPIYRLKQELRGRVLALRGALSDERRQQFSTAIIERLLTSPYYAEADSILFFASFRDEVNLWEAVKQALADHKTVLLPRMKAEETALDVYRIVALDHLSPGRWGILEPDADACRLVPPEQIDLVIMPGVAFDRAGRRLGYGKGYYDRLLTEVGTDVPKVAAAYGCQLVDEVPVDGHDVNVDAIITEEGIIKT